MRRIMTNGPGNTFSEALDAASGGLLFVALCVLIGGLVALAGWAVGTYPTVGILFGCATLSTLVASAVWGILHWGVDEPMVVKTVGTRRTQERPGIKRAA